MKEHQFRRLTVWQRSMRFVSKIYSLTATFPKIEQFGLIDQVRRAAVSIPLNIAEGSGSGSNNEFIRFLLIAKRSVYEVITALEIAKNLNYASAVTLDSHIIEAEEIVAMIVGLIKQLKSR